MKIFEDGIFAHRKEWIKRIGSVTHALNVSFKMIALTFSHEFVYLFAFFLLLISLNACFLLLKIICGYAKTRQGSDC